ncbi:MAG: putative DNA binding domain-containing protein [Flavobacteriales bacterium]|nr:MAG: putative DNA binding domain-containing protein [Flavobacteriales bacterium]
MDQAQLNALLDRLLLERSERDWLEFKQGLDAELLGRNLSAVANSACVRSQPYGYVVFGIRDSDREVVGASFDPDHVLAKGNQLLPIYLSTQLRPNPGFDSFVVQHASGRVVMYRIHRAAGDPVKFQGTAWEKVGTSTTQLDSRPDLLRSIVNSERDWSGEICSDATLMDLDPVAIQKAREEYKKKFPATADQVDEWPDLTFLNKAKVTKQGGITNAALLLLGKSTSSGLLTPAVANIMWVVKDGQGAEIGGRPFHPPFILASDELFRSIRNIPIRELAPGSLFPSEIQPYDPWVIREALHNCIAHQDYSLRARIQMVENPDSLLFTNAGHFLPTSIEDVIQQDAPWDIYRNRWLADAMFSLNMIETQGGGIKRMFREQARRFLPMPDFDFSRENRVFVTIPGKVIDERYTRLLMRVTDLPLDRIILLDRVQRHRRISREEHKQLKSEGLVEGRYPNLHISGAVARATGEEVKYVRAKGLQDAQYEEFVIRLLEEMPHGVRRSDIDNLILPMLPTVMTPAQKRNKVHNLIQRMSRDGTILNSGARGPSSLWVLGV